LYSRELRRWLPALMLCASSIARADFVDLTPVRDPTTITETCLNGTDASHTVSVKGPSQLQAGRPERVQITVTNTSARAVDLWLGEQFTVPARLGAWAGSAFGFNNQVRWDGWKCGGYRKHGVTDQRAFLNAPATIVDTACVGANAPGTIRPGESNTFDFWITAPELPAPGAPNVVNFSWAMVMDSGSACQGFFPEAWSVAMPIAALPKSTCTVDAAAVPDQAQWLLSVWNNEIQDSVIGTDLTRTEDETPVERHYVPLDLNGQVSGADGSSTSGRVRLNLLDGARRLSACGTLTHYSARLERKVQLDAGLYGFTSTGDDGYRVHLIPEGVAGSGIKVFDHWLAPQRTIGERTGVGIPTSGLYTIVIDWFQADGGAALELSWERVDPAPPTPPNAPAAPTLNTPTASNTEVALDWTSIPNAIYNVYGGTATGERGLRQSGLLGTNTKDHAGPVDVDTTFYYVVRAKVNGVESADSNEVSVLVRPGTSTPPPAVPAPQLSLDSVAGTTVSLHWSAVDRAQYKLKRATAASGPFQVVQSGSTATSTTDSPANGTWFYAVSATVDGVEGPDSNVVGPAQVPAPSAQPTVALAIVDASGKTIDRLASNADGWPAPNPLALRATLTCPANAPADCSGQLRVSMAGAQGALRVYALPDDPVCAVDGRLHFSQHRISWSCPATLPGGVSLHPGQSRTLSFRVMVQPSGADTMRIDASWFSGSAQPLQVGVPAASIHPLVVAPGILGTMPPAYGRGQLDPLLNVYQPLLEQLQAMGYEEGVTLFRFPYDWRNSNRVTARFLRDRIREALAAAKPAYARSDKVDLLVHSMGGIITRTLVEDEAREVDGRTPIVYNPATEGIRKVIFTATPHLGFPEDYKTFESMTWSEFLGDTPVQSVAMNVLLYPALVHKQWAKAHPGQSLPVRQCLNNGICVTDDYAMAHDESGGGIDSLREMLPTAQADVEYGPYLCSIGQPCQKPAAYPFGQQFNPLLPTLNASTKVSLLAQRIGVENLYVIYGTDPSGPGSTANDTDVVYDVQQFVRGLDEAGWANGIPYQTFTTKAGDDLIPDYSTNLRLLLPGIPAENVAGARTAATGELRFGLPGQQFRHKEIMRSHELQTVYAPRWLAGLDPLTFEQPYTPPSISLALIEGLKWLIVGECPVNLLFTDQAGRRLGYDPVTGSTYNDFGAALYASPNVESQFMELGDLPPGSYNLRLNAFGDGDYRLSLHHVAGTATPRIWIAEGSVKTGDVVDLPIVIPASVPAGNHPPVADAGPDQRVQAGLACTADVRLDGSRSSDPDGEALSFDWSGTFGRAIGVQPLVSLPPGKHDIVLHVQDGQGLGALAHTNVMVTTRPPVIAAITASPADLEPADGTLRDVNVTVDVSAQCGQPACRIVDIDSNQGGKGDASFNGLTAKLRAARSPDGDGRRYRITLECAVPGAAPVRKQVVVRVPPAGRMKGQGSIRRETLSYQFKFDLSESGSGKDAGSVRVDVKHDDGDHDADDRTRRFLSTRLDVVRFSNDDDLTPGGVAKVDTVRASGAGTWDGQLGYTFELTATDAGEPGAGRDRFRIVVRDASGNTVASVDDRIDTGNIQSVKPPK
jgi:hypothetical protein